MVSDTPDVRDLVDGEEVCSHVQGDGLHAGVVSAYRLHNAGAVDRQLVVVRDGGVRGNCRDRPFDDDCKFNKERVDGFELLDPCENTLCNRPAGSIRGVL